MIHLSNLNKWVWILIFFSCAASGQVALETQAPDLKTESAVDSYGVDLIGGEPLISGVNLSIGPAHNNGIKINDSSFNGMRNTYVGYVTYMQSLGREGGCSMLKSGRFFEVFRTCCIRVCFQ